MKNDITVVYNDPGGRRVTFHPKLGKLVSGKPFKLDQKTAEFYIESGLLSDPTGKFPKPKPSEEVETKKKGGN